jgi:hypothetical protein
MATLPTLPTIFYQRPHHLSYYEDDLVYDIKEISLARDSRVIQTVGELPVEEGYDPVTEELDKAYVRIFYCKSTKEYRVAMTLTPWPAFVEDPFRSGECSLVGESSLRSALEQIHRIYFCFRHESRCPVPYYGYYMDVRLHSEAIERIQKGVAWGS